jgi:UDP-glucose 4-epimerase
MKILISGAAGFLGRNFAKFYDTEDNMIDAVDNMQNPHSVMPELKYGWTYHDDIRNFIGYFSTSRDKVYDLFFHFAAPVGGREKIQNDPLYNAESLAIDSDVFRWAIGRVDKMVYPSSAAVYPVDLQTDYPKFKMLESYFRPWASTWNDPDMMYGFTKLVGEYVGWNASMKGLKVKVIRPFSGYGEGQSQEYPFPSLMRRIVSREDPITIWGDGNQVRDFIHVDDVVKMTDKFINTHNDLGYDMINLSSGVGTSFNELVDMALDIEGWQPSSIKYYSDKPVGVMHRVGDTALQETRGLTPIVTLEDGIRRMLYYERKQV